MLDKKMIIEITSTAAIIALLIFVGMQIQQSAAATRSATVLQLEESIRIDFDQIDWDDKSAGMRVKRLWRHGKQMRMIEIGPDSGEPDWCEEGHVGFILEGALETNIDGMIERLSAGDGLIIPSGNEYRHKSKSVDGVVRLVLVDDA